MRFLSFTATIAAGFALAACGGVTNSGAPLTPQSQMGGGMQTQAQTQSSSISPLIKITEPNVKPACNPNPGPGQATCLALVRTDIAQSGSSPSGYGPSDLQGAYNLTSESASDGAGQTIAVVEAYGDSHAPSDLAHYRTYYNLPPCTASSGCLTILNEEGQTSPLPADCASCGWDLEESLDMEMVSAICPNCHVVIMEANSQSYKDLSTAAQSAEKVANVVSNSWQYGSSEQEYSEYASYFTHPGVVVLASSGDSAYENPEGFPAAYPDVVAVGGTTLHYANGNRVSETVWNDTGSGCNTLSKKPPSYQKKIDGMKTHCKGRLANDVSAVADPNTGVAVYDTLSYGGWVQVGGTSVSSPLVGSIYGLAGNAATIDPFTSLYATGASLFDITAGRNGAQCAAFSKKTAFWCEAEVGYDGPTGNGTPNGIGAF